MDLANDNWVYKKKWYLKSVEENGEIANHGFNLLILTLILEVSNCQMCREGSIFANIFLFWVVIVIWVVIVAFACLLQ